MRSSDRIDRVFSALLLALGALLPGCAGGPDGASTGRIIVPVPTRALWIDSWGPGFRTPAECDELVERAAAAGFDTLIVEVRKTGDAYHSSAIEPRGRIEPGTEPVEASFDPLERLVSTARARRGMRIEAWIVANRVWKGASDPPPSDPPHILSKRPEWTLIDERGRAKDSAAEGSVYVDPSEPAARAHVARIAADIAARYAVDAVHLDYIRYPGAAWGFGERSLARFAAETGRTGRPSPADAEFTAWRARQVTDEVREIRNAVKRARPEVELTAAVIAWGSPPRDGFRSSRAWREACQDWPLWCEEGLLDAVYPMHYKRESVAAQAADFRGWLDEFRRIAAKSRARFVIGLGAYLNEREQSLAQARAVMAAGFDGIAVFSYRHPEKDAKSFVDAGFFDGFVEP